MAGDLTLTHKSLFINRTAALDQHLLIVGLDLIMHEGKSHLIGSVYCCIALHTIESFFLLAKLVDFNKSFI
jgi:hypothetical protein